MTSWLTQSTPRRLQLSQVSGVSAEKVHRALRRLQSQQLWVPFRNFRRFGVGPVESANEEGRRGTVLCSIVQVVGETDIRTGIDSIDAMIREDEKTSLSSPLSA